MIDTSYPEQRRNGVSAQVIELGFFALMVVIACSGL